MSRRLLLPALLALLCVPTAHAKGKLKVFILAGQSNMEGAGAIKADPKRNEGKGSLEYLVKAPETKKRFAHLVDGKGEWVVRDDVWIWYFDRKGGLSVGYGAKSDRVGPELGFGTVVGDHFDEQVLLIKIAWGGKSLAVDFRPPSAGDEVGPFYKKLFEHTRDVLGNLKTYFPDYDGQGYEIVGFGWHQGWNDRVNQAHNDAYEENMAHFIRDVRKELKIEKLPFVIAETGMSGHEEKHPRALSLMKAQAAVAKRPEFLGNVAFVGTRDFYRPKEVSPSGQAYHWNSNAETYYLIGEGMGKAMVGLLGGKPLEERSRLSGLFRARNDELRLRSILAPGPVLAEQVEARAEHDRVTGRHLEEAKRACGVIERQDEPGGPVLWALPRLGVDKPDEGRPECDDEFGA